MFPARSFNTSETDYVNGRAMSLLNVHGSFGPSGNVSFTSQGFKTADADYTTSGNIFDRGGAKTTRDALGFTTVFRFLRLDFFDFLQKRDWATARQLLSADSQLASLRDDQGATPLIVLSKFEFAGPNAEMIKLLLDAGADINAQAKDGTTALHNAAKEHDIVYMDFLLSKDANPKLAIHDSVYPTTNGFTPLHFLLGAYDTRPRRVPAAQKIDGIELLLSHGADINAKDDTGASPLHLAARWGDPEIVAALLAKGADREAGNNYGLTPLASISDLNDTAAIHRVRELLKGK